MISNKYACAYKEVVEILKYTKTEDIKKIPSYKILMYVKYMDNTYQFEVDKNKKLEEQNISNEAKAILANLYRDYWATTYQRQKILKKENDDMIAYEYEKYNPDNIFKNNKVDNDISKNDDNLKNTVASNNLEKIDKDLLLDEETLFSKIKRKIYQILKK